MSIISSLCYITSAILPTERNRTGTIILAMKFYVRKLVFYFPLLNFNHPSSGRAMKAKDTLYHEEGCFVCAECSLDLRESAVYSKDAALYCEKHYKEKFVPKCARCLDYITEVSLSGRRSPDNMTFA